MAITAIHPYLSFNGNCEEAFAHYAKVLGAKSTGVFRYGEAPPEPDQDSDSSPPGCEPLPADWKDKVMNTELRIGDLILMGADSPPQYQTTTEGMTVSVQTDDPAEAERLFAGMMEGSTDIMMPMGETFWAIRFGMGTDRFGTPWMVNCMRKPEA